jgi:hypothetical protein
LAQNSHISAQKSSNIHAIYHPDNAGAVRGHPARIVAILPWPVARKYDKRQATGRIAAARLFVDHGGPHCISIEINRVRFHTTIS